MRQQTLGALADVYIDYARQIHTAGHEVHRKIRDMLEYAQLSSGEIPLRPARTDLAALLAEVAERHATTAEEKGVALHWRAPEGLAAELDAERMEQALHQLVSNAVRFTDEGEVRISAEPVRDGMVALEVADTGIGIPPEKIAQIGKPFERAGEAYNSHRGGSGIGLAIAKAIVEMHGGRMEIDSEPGRGTRVRLILPKAQGRPQAGVAEDDNMAVKAGDGVTIEAEKRINADPAPFPAE
jgi:signal transduction histidine kinase